MGAAVDFTGKKFGRLTAIRLVGHNRSRLRVWRWRCDCGKEIDRPPQAIKEGRQVSCGCHRDEQSRSRATHGRSNTRTYRAWIEMKGRCRGKDEPSRRHYVARGIKVCRRWEKSFAAFLADMGECPKHLTLERLDNDDGYHPRNCAWASQAAQIRNTRNTIRVSAPWTNSFGVTLPRVMCLKDACGITGANYDRVRSRIRSGASPQIALERG